MMVIMTMMMVMRTKTMVMTNLQNALYACRRLTESMTLFLKTRQNSR